MTPHKQAQLIAARFREAAARHEVEPLTHDGGAVLADIRERFRPGRLCRLPHIGGRLDDRRRVSLGALEWHPAEGTLEAVVHGAWATLSPATGCARGHSAIDARNRGGRREMRLRLNSRVAVRLRLGAGDLVLVFADEARGVLHVTSAAILAGCTPPPSESATA